MITGFLLKKPDAKRRTYQILPYQRVNGKLVYFSPVKTKELDALNASLKAGTLGSHQVEIEIKTKILVELKRKAKVPEKVVAEAMISENNLKVFKAFWNDEYRRKRLERVSTARDEFLAALRILEPLSLHSCSIDELQDHWDNKESTSGTRHKRYGNRINQLLKYLGRGIEIRTNRAEVPPLKWVTWEELERILEHVTNPHLKDLYQSLWATGCRLGELFVIEPDDIRKNGTIFVHRQMTEKKKIKPYTKNKKAHDTIILPEGMAALKRWAAFSDKSTLRQCCCHPLIEAAKKAFPKNPIKQISPHKLRHSYVKKMMTLGVPIDRVAIFLGDRVSTVENVYRQWTITDAEIEYVKEIMQLGYKRLK